MGYHVSRIDDEVIGKDTDAYWTFQPRHFQLDLQENLKWRLKHWLGEGSTRVEPLLGEIRMPVLVLAGSEDHMLPSVDEAERLSDLIPTCQKVRSISELSAPLPWHTD